ncbi:thiamine pyrophosphate-dependent enzyme [Streptomyces sp. NPDC003233]
MLSPRLAAAARFGGGRGTSTTPPGQRRGNGPHEFNQVRGPWRSGRSGVLAGCGGGRCGSGGGAGDGGERQAGAGHSGKPGPGGERIDHGVVERTYQWGDGGRTGHHRRGQAARGVVAAGPAGAGRRQAGHQWRRHRRRDGRQRIGVTPVPGTDITGIDFAALAESFGCPAARAEHPDELPAALDHALGRGDGSGPFLLHLRVGGSAGTLYEPWAG